jgi:hypothetical protein
MDYFLLIGSLTLFLQIGVLFLIVEGYLFRKQQKFRAHGFLMFSGVVLHLTAILVIMVPSFLEGLLPRVVNSFFEPISLLTTAHVIVGLVSLVLGVWIVGFWRFSKSLQYCAPKRPWMKFTFRIWLVALLLGFLLYLELFWHLLFG